VKALAPTFRYWMQTEVHVFAFSVAANVLLSFFPFLIVMGSISRRMFSLDTTRASIDTAMNEFFPGALSDFVSRNLFPSAHIELFSLVLLLFTANGIFEPLEVALNHVWGVRKNRNYFHNQAVSFALIFACGALAALSVLLTGLNHITAQSVMGFGNWIPALVFKLAAVPVTIVVLFLIYYFVPNFRPRESRDRRGRHHRSSHGRPEVPEQAGLAVDVSENFERIRRVQVFGHAHHTGNFAFRCWHLPEPNGPRGAIARYRETRGGDPCLNGALTVPWPRSPAHRPESAPCLRANSPRAATIFC